MAWRLGLGGTTLGAGVIMLIMFLEDILMVKIGAIWGFGIVSIPITIGTALFIWFFADWIKKKLNKKRRRRKRRKK